ncbi:MAG: hypothetical protein AB7K24_28410 [Gemmataceae bacterium]
MKTDLVLAATIEPANHGDADTLCDSVMQAQINLKQADSAVPIEEVVADKGYHKAGTLELCAAKIGTDAVEWIRLFDLAQSATGSFAGSMDDLHEA